MPWFFIISLLLSIALVVALLIGIFWSLQYNRCQRNKHAWSYLLSLVYVGLMIIVVVIDTQPKLVDAVYVLSHNPAVSEFKANNIAIKGHALIYNNECYILSPTAELPKLEGGDLRVTYAPYSRIILSIEPITTNKK